MEQLDAVKKHVAEMKGTVEAIKKIVYGIREFARTKKNQNVLQTTFDEEDITHSPPPIDIFRSPLQLEVMLLPILSFSYISFTFLTISHLVT